jgi:hypothetical protein
MSRMVGSPEPGYFKKKLVKGGPWVAVRFYIEAGAIRCEVNGYTEKADGTPFDPYEQWPLCWPSTEADYRYYTTVREWAERHAPQLHPAARPREPIDLGAMPPRRRP